MKETVAKSYCLTSVGRVRQSNEDSVAIIERPHFTLLAVCDGMGGHRKGEVASRIAIDTLEREFGNISNEVSTWKGKRRSGNQSRLQPFTGLEAFRRLGRQRADRNAAVAEG